MAKKKKTNDQDSSMRMGEFASAIMQIADEKGISKEKVIETIEIALAAAYKKDYGKKGQNIRAEFNEVSGDTKFYLVKEVVDESTREFVDPEEEAQALAESEDGDPTAERVRRKKEPSKESESDEEKLPRFNLERDITLEDAKKTKKSIKLGDVIETKLESKEDYGRVAAQTAKQVIIQRIREAERDSMFEEYKEKEGEVISGVVQRVEGRNVFVDLGKSVGVLFPSEQIRGENYRIGQRVKVHIMRVESDPKGPGISLSRTHPEMVRKLFELEVPEIFAGTVEIKAIAREAGFRTKIAVASTENGIDPIGSCVGQKGTRVQAVIDEIGGEKIDIIEWSEDVEKFISASLSPAKVLSVELREKERESEVSVPDDQLSLAIGKQGQNVRLAAKLTGWKINVSGASKEEDEDKEGKRDKDPEKSSSDANEADEKEKDVKKESKKEVKKETAKKDPAKSSKDDSGAGKKKDPKKEDE